MLRKFKKGDRVVLKSKDYHAYGDKGTVMKWIEKHEAYYISWDARATLMITEDAIELVSVFESPLYKVLTE